MTRTIISPARCNRRGSASLVGVILLVTIACLGAIVGLVQVRNKIVQEFGDAAVALDNLDQSYSVLVEIDTTGNGVPDTIVYEAEYEDPGATLVDPINGSPAGLLFEASPPVEGPVPPPVGSLP